MSDNLSRIKSHLYPPSSNFRWSDMSPLMLKDEEAHYTSKVFPFSDNASALELPLFNIIAQGTFANFKQLSNKPRKINNQSGSGRANECQTYEHEREWLGFKAAKELLQFFGPGTLFRKDDIVAAYKIPPLKLQDFHV